MPRRALEALTEPMFYILMALTGGAKCGTEIAAWISQHSCGRVRIGPGTLYTILGSFQKAGLIVETETEGRRRTYDMTELGRERYEAELARLRQCVEDADRRGDVCAENGALPVHAMGG